MPSNPDTHSFTDRMSFFREFLQNPAQIGSVIPSSRFMERRIVEATDIASAKIVVELGPGTGGTTRALLKAMPKDGVLLSIELNPQLHKRLAKIQDTRLIAHLGSAGDLGSIIAEHGLEAPCIVVSGMPFSTIRQSMGTRIVEQVFDVLKPGGQFVAYQVNPRVAHLCRPIMGQPRVSTELLNIPPMRIYQWEKQPAQA